nr:Gag-Pol polyprotein [Tanacetum cinerariifolium]
KSLQINNNNSLLYIQYLVHLTHVSMATQQEIFKAGSKNRPPMLSKDDYVQWSSKIIRYRRIQPNIKLLAKSIMEGPYEYKQVLEPGDDTATPRVPNIYRP